jgi:hypothetical protein
LLSNTLKQEKKRREEGSQPRRSTSLTSLFSEPSSPEEPLSTNAASRPPEKRDSSIANAAFRPPRIPRRRTNPQNKVLMAPSELASGSGISTKQRLAQGALNPTVPKAAASTAAGRPSLSQLKTPANSLMNLSFKKTRASASGSASSPKFPDVDRRNSVDMQPPMGGQDPTLAALNASSTLRTSASMSPMIMNTVVPYVASPGHFTMPDPLPDLFTTNEVK